MLPPEGISPLDNVGYNRRVWDWYAEKWSDLDFRRRQLGYEGRYDEDPAAVSRLGEEWGRLEDARQVVDEWIIPHVDGSTVAGEIGTGGGRIARLVAPRVKQFHAFDISPRMIDLVRRELAGVADVRFHVLDGPRLPDGLDGHFDFLYAFDVFVHLDLHVQWRYLDDMHRLLKPGGRAFIHTADLTTKAGWERFAAQDAYRVEGFYFMTPQAVATLASRAGLRLLDERSGSDEGNFYYERDYFALLEKPHP
jgi:SAM-dependent methyltransferase